MGMHLIPRCHNLKPIGSLMAKRSRIPQGKSQRSFTRHARPHPKNTPPLGMPMRGGIRL